MSRKAVCLLAAACAFATSQGFTAEGPIEFKIPEYNDEIVVSSRVNGVGRLCVIDSGYAANAFDSKLRSQFGESRGRITGVAFNGEDVSVEAFPPPEVALVTFELSRENPVFCFDMTSYREASGLNIEGVLGMPLFRSCTVLLDFDHQLLRILRGSTDPVPDWGKPIKVSYSEHDLPTMPITLPGGTTSPATIDTGFTGSLSLSSKIFEALLQRGDIVPLETAMCVQANGVRYLRSGILKNLRIGEIENKELRVNNGGEDCAVGLRYLRRFHVVFDLGRDRLYLAKGAGFDVPDTKHIGMDMLRKDRRTIVVYVQRNSGPEKAGVLTNDELVSVAGMPITDQPIGKIHWMIRDKADSSGTAVLGIRRNGVERSLPISIPK